MCIRDRSLPFRPCGRTGGLSFLPQAPLLAVSYTHLCYDHAVATYALCAAYTFCKQMDIHSIANLDKAVIKAVDKILDNQNGDGGWAYNYNTKAGACLLYTSFGADLTVLILGASTEAASAAGFFSAAAAFLVVEAVLSLIHI